MRLVHGDMSLYAGVLALVLAPEAYLPLRQVGSKFHDSADGLAAAKAAFALIEGGGEEGCVRCGFSPDPTRPWLLGRFGPQGSRWGSFEVGLGGVGVLGRDGWAPRGLSMTIRPGRLTMITGPNGSGKSTALEVIMGLIEPDEGRVLRARTNSTSSGGGSRGCRSSRLSCRGASPRT